MCKRDFAFILALRGESTLGSTAKVAAYKTAVGTITPDEEEKVTEWMKLSANVNMEPYAKYTPDELKKRFEEMTRHTFPLPLKILHNNAEKKKSYIVGYYQWRGYDLTVKQTQFTQEQIELINVTTGFYIVNAGPGTGKTTVVNERAYQLRDEGVMVISYTNATIDESYRRFRLYPDTRFSGKKKYDNKKKVVFTTVDSLACHITDKPNSDFDQTVRQAIQRLRQGLCKLPYKHIICDECQDIDDLRSELIQLLLSQSRSLFLFGDPRQCITKDCHWYSQLWAQPDNNVTRAGLSQSFRFASTGMIDLVNAVSQHRPELHHELTPSEHLVPFDGVPLVLHQFSPDYDEAGFKELASYIRQLYDNGVSYDNICVVCPSLNRQNRTSSYASRIYAVFRHEGIPCHGGQHGAFVPSGVLFSTIHAVKGREFDYVFLCGMSNFPNTFSMIPREQADALIFVAHSRARKQMHYVSSSYKFILPHGVDQKYVQILEGQHFGMARNVLETKTPHYAIRNMAEDPNFHTLLKCNGFKLDYGLKKTLTQGRPSFTLPSCPPKVDKMFWGILCGLTVETMLLNNHLPVFHDFINVDESKQHGEDHINYPSREEINTFKQALSKTVDELDSADYIILARVYTYIQNRNMINRYDAADWDGFDGPAFVQSYRTFTMRLNRRYGKAWDVECKVGDEDDDFIGYADVVFQHNVVEFKTTPHEFNKSDALQVLLYSLFLPQENGKFRVPELVNLTTGEVSLVTTEQDKLQWKYITERYLELRTHVDCVTSRRNYWGISQTITDPNMSWFVVDTEFHGYTQDIFEIAVINVMRPYESIIQAVRSGDSEGASSWSKQPQQLFDAGLDIGEVQGLFQALPSLHSTKPVLIHYKAKTDVAWINAKSIDLASMAREIGKLEGTFEAGSQPPSLSAFYELKCMLIEGQSHLRPHTALSDALMLYELVVLDKCKLEQCNLNTVEVEITQVEPPKDLDPVYSAIQHVHNYSDEIIDDGIHAVPWKVVRLCQRWLGGVYTG